MKTLKNNWQIKLISFLVAFFLWSFVITSENPVVTTRFTSVPVILENEEYLSEQGLILMNNSKYYIDLQVSGKRNQVINLTSNHLRVSSDLMGLGEGVHNIKLNYDLPQGISLAGEPQSVSVDIQKDINKEFTVSVKTIGDLEENYLLKTLKVTPEKVSLHGARSLIERVDSLQASLDLKNVHDDIVSNVKISALDKDGKQVENVSLGQDFVNINALVLKTKELEIKPVFEKELAPEYRLKNSKISPSKVYVKGNKKDIDNLDFISTNPIDLSSVSDNTKMEAKLNLPKNVDFVNPDINYLIEIEVEKKISKTLEVPVGAIKIENIDNLSYNFKSNKFNIVVSGFADVINSLTYKDLEFSLDISKLGIGDHNIGPDIKEKTGIEVKSKDNVNIEIN